MSACELTDTYSPAAIDIAPATSPATPAISTLLGVRARRGDADDQARRRDDAVIGAEHRGAQPADAAGMVVFGMDAKTGHPGYDLKKLRTSSLMSSTDTLIEELDGDLEEPAGIGLRKLDLDFRRRRFIGADRNQALLAQAAAQGEGQPRLVEFERQLKPAGERPITQDQAGWRWPVPGLYVESDLLRDFPHAHMSEEACRIPIIDERQIVLAHDAAKLRDEEIEPLGVEMDLVREEFRLGPQRRIDELIEDRNDMERPPVPAPGGELIGEHARHRVSFSLQAIGGIVRIPGVAVRGGNRHRDEDRMRELLLEQSAKRGQAVRDLSHGFRKRYAGVHRDFHGSGPHVDLAERETNGRRVRGFPDMLQDLDAPLARDHAEIGFRDEIVSKRRAGISGSKYWGRGSGCRIP